MPSEEARNVSTPTVQSPGMVMRVMLPAVQSIAADTLSPAAITGPLRMERVIVSLLLVLVIGRRLVLRLAGRIDLAAVRHLEQRVALQLFQPVVVALDFLPYTI